MVFNFFKKKTKQSSNEASHLPKNKRSDLQQRCKDYLTQGPPTCMANYVPESLTEVIIAHGASTQKLDDELREVGFIIVNEPDFLGGEDNEEISQYMKQGQKLVQEVIAIL